MVRQGVNAIILEPVDSVAEAPAINAAGQGGRPGHPRRHPARPQHAVRRRRLVPEPGPGRRRRPRHHQEGQHRHRQGHRGERERRRAVQPGARRPEELPEHPRRRDALRQLGRGHGEDRGRPVHRLTPAAPGRRHPGRRHDGGNRGGVPGGRPQGPDDRRRRVLRRRPVLVAGPQVDVQDRRRLLQRVSRAPTRTSTSRSGCSTTRARSTTSWRCRHPPSRTPTSPRTPSPACRSARRPRSAARSPRGATTPAWTSTSTLTGAATAELGRRAWSHASAGLRPRRRGTQPPA